MPAPRHGDVAAGHRREVARALEANEEALDPRLELARIERPGDDVVGPRLEEAHPLLDVVLLADTEHRDPGQRRCPPDLGTDLDAGARRVHGIDDDEREVAGAAHGLVGIRHDRDLVATRPQTRLRSGRRLRLPPIAGESSWSSPLLLLPRGSMR